MAQFASKEAVANTPRSPRFDNSISQEYDFVNSDGENILYQERPDKSKQSNFIGQGNGYRGLRKSDFYENSTIYSYDFLVNQSDMRVTQLPEISDVADGNGKIIRSDIVKAALDNARKNGKEVNGVIYVTNEYTERDYGISTQAVRHSLGGDRNR